MFTLKTTTIQMCTPVYHHECFVIFQSWHLILSKYRPISRGIYNRDKCVQFLSLCCKYWNTALFYPSSVYGYWNLVYSSSGFVVSQRVLLYGEIKCYKSPISTEILHCFTPLLSLDTEIWSTPLLVLLCLKESSCMGRLSAIKVQLELFCPAGPTASPCPRKPWKSLRRRPKKMQRKPNGKQRWVSKYESIVLWSEWILFFFHTYSV